MRLAFVMLMAALLSSCATVQPVSSDLGSSTEHKIDRNYTLGKEASAFVGQPIVRVKDYWVRTDARAALQPDQAFSVFLPLFGPNIAIGAAEPLPMVGTQVRDGITYRLVQLQGLPLSFLVKPDGTFDGRAVNMYGAKMGYTYDFKPATVKLSPVVAEQVSTDRGYLNFELVYSGANKDEISLLYREYTPQDLARPAFTQNLTYERGTSTIRFRDIKITVLGADNERIRYVVDEDGLQPGSTGAR